MTLKQPVTHLAFIRASSGRSAELGARCVTCSSPRCVHRDA